MATKKAKSKAVKTIEKAVRKAVRKGVADKDVEQAAVDDCESGQLFHFFANPEAAQRKTGKQAAFLLEE